jgi:hypothetical protein
MKLTQEQIQAGLDAGRGMTEAEIDAGIEEAFAQAVKDGVVMDTGKTKWSERRQRMIPVYTSLIFVPPAKERN